MARKPGTTVLDPCTPFESAFEQVAQLRRDRERNREPQQQRREADQVCPCTRNHSGAGDTADQSGNGLVGANRRRKFRSANRTTGEIGSDVGRPDNEKYPDQEVEALADILDFGPLTNPQERDRWKEAIDEAGQFPSKAPSGNDP